MISTYLALIPTFLSFLPHSWVTEVVGNMTLMWDNLTEGEKEVVYATTEVLDLLQGLGTWRYPLGVGLVGLYGTLFLAKQHRLLPWVQEDPLLATLEYVAMVAGLVLGGPAFLLGAEAFRAMRGGAFRQLGLVLLLLVLSELCPVLLGLLPRRPAPTKTFFFF